MRLVHTGNTRYVQETPSGILVTGVDVAMAVLQGLSSPQWQDTLICKCYPGHCKAHNEGGKVETYATVENSREMHVRSALISSIHP